VCGGGGNSFPLSFINYLAPTRSDESPRFIYLHLRAQFLGLLLLHRSSKNLSEALERGPLKVRLIEVSWEEGMASEEMGQEEEGSPQET
jgi:hypothetical protein